MKCFYQEGESECSNSPVVICADCQNQAAFCKLHIGAHIIETKHKVLDIEQSRSLILKKAIRTCINKIAQDSNDIILEIKRISLASIIELKKINKNAKSIDEFILKSFDPKRISFLIDQVSLLDKQMNESPNEIISKLKYIISEKQSIISNQNDEFERLGVQIKYLTDNQKDFNDSALEIRFKEAMRNWNFFCDSGTKQLLLSRDRKYLFQCIFHLGHFQVDCSLHLRE